MVELEFPFDHRINDVLGSTRTAAWDPVLRRWRVSVGEMDGLALRLRSIGVALKTVYGSRGAREARAGHAATGADRQVPDTAQERGSGGTRSSASAAVSQTGATLLRRTEDELRLRGYATRTRLAYLTLLKRFVIAMGDEPITVSRTRGYLIALLDGELSVGYHGQLAAALRFFCTYVLRVELEPGELPSPKRGLGLPNVLSVEDVRRLIDASHNPGHRLMILLMYSAGLRVGEVVRLQHRDFDADRRLISVRRGKGHKDRVTLYSERIASALEDYRSFRIALGRAVDVDAMSLVFPGRRPGQAISSRTIQHVVTETAKRAGIEKPVTPHTLRHSFATHLLEQGINLRYIQELLGHASSRTTEIYTHVTTRDLVRIRSPLDVLDDE
jgi:site-specific recombinase XerD